MATMSRIGADLSPITCIFGLENLPIVFTILMDTYFLQLEELDLIKLIFLDDIIIYSSTFESMQHNEQVMIRLQ